MCKIISVTVNAGIDLAEFARVTKGAFEQLTDAAVPPQLPTDRAYFIDAGYCNCGSDLGAGYWPIEGPYTADELREMERKGGSPAKLERWKQRRIREYERVRSNVAGLAEMREWLQLAREVLEIPSATRFGIMHHWYCGQVEEERFDVSLLPTRSVSDVREEDLLALPGDTLLEMRR